MAGFNFCPQCMHPAHLPQPCGGGCECQVAEVLPGMSAEVLRRIEAAERAHQKRAAERAEVLNRIAQRQIGGRPADREGKG